MVPNTVVLSAAVVPIKEPDSVDVKVRLKGSNRFTHAGVGPHAINAPMTFPRMNEMIVASASSPIVHGTA